MLNGKVCKWCGKTFIKKDDQKPSSFKKQQYCCRKCSAAYASSLTVGKKAHNNKQVERICRYCGKVDLVSPSYSNRPFCSQICMAKWYSENNIAEAHWNWQGGITESVCRDSLYPGYKEWRKSVFRRDNYTCQCCGDNTSGRLNAHHIKPRAQYPELILDVDNGVTLCVGCHKEVHYGSKL